MVFLPDFVLYINHTIYCYKCNQLIKSIHTDLSIIKMQYYDDYILFSNQYGELCIFDLVSEILVNYRIYCDTTSELLIYMILNLPLPAVKKIIKILPYDINNLIVDNFGELIISDMKRNIINIGSKNIITSNIGVSNYLFMDINNNLIIVSSTLMIKIFNILTKKRKFFSGAYTTDTLSNIEYEPKTNSLLYFKNDKLTRFDLNTFKETNISDQIKLPPIDIYFGNFSLKKTLWISYSPSFIARYKSYIIYICIVNNYHKGNMHKDEIMCIFEMFINLNATANIMNFCRSKLTF